MASRVFQPADITFSMLSEAYLAELRAGTAGPIESYAKAFPHLAREIQAHFPTMGALEAAVGASDEASSSTLLSPGDELGGCRIECEIGRGAMGIVYKTYQADLSRHVAIKVIPLVGVSAGTVDRFELERRALARLDHPSIVPVYAYGHNASFAYLIMRYIDGVSLDKLLAENSSYKMKSALVSLQADWRHFAISAANIASGLQHAHDNGLVHRDVKPANIIMDERGLVD